VAETYEFAIPALNNVSPHPLHREQRLILHIRPRHYSWKSYAHEDLADAVKDAWTVIKVVPEKLSLKTDTFADLEKLAPIFTILVTNFRARIGVVNCWRKWEVRRGGEPSTPQYMMRPDRIVELMTDGETDK